MIKGTDFRKPEANKSEAKWLWGLDVRLEVSKRLGSVGSNANIPNL